MSQNLIAPILLLGGPLSGTDLLETTLDRHPGITVLREASQLTGGASDSPCSLRELVGTITSTDNDRSGTNTIAPHIATDAARQFLLTILSGHPAHQQKNNLVLVSRDTPEGNEFLLNLFPGAKIVHIFRDGRDIACCNMSNEKESPHEPLSDRGKPAYLDVLKKWYDWEVNLKPLLQDENVISISYEQLVQTPEQVIQSVLSFLEIPYQEVMLEGFDFAKSGRASGNGQTLDEDDTGRESLHREIGRWTKEIPYQEWPKIDLLYGAFFEELGYQKCSDASAAASQFSTSAGSDDHSELMDSVEQEILALHQTIHRKNEKIKRQLHLLAEKDTLLLQNNDQIKKQGGLIEELTYKVNITLPNLENQLKQKVNTIGHLQHVLRQQDDLSLIHI